MDILPEARKRILEFQRRLLEGGFFVGKAVEPQNIHLTLKFLGEIDEDVLGKVIDSLEGLSFNPFVARLDGAGVFSRDFVRIVWVHVGGVDGLFEKIDSSLEGLFAREKRFMSHVTVARVKKLLKRRELFEFLEGEKIDFEFEVRSFSVFRSILSSEGARYELLWRKTC